MEDVYCGGSISRGKYAITSVVVPMLKKERNV